MWLDILTTILPINCTTQDGTVQGNIQPIEIFWACRDRYNLWNFKIKTYALNTVTSYQETVYVSTPKFIHIKWEKTTCT